MKILRMVPLLGLCILPATCLAQKVRVDFDARVDFSMFETYKWKEGTRVKNDLNHQRIVHAVENQLAINGFREVEDEKPDIYIIYHASAKEKLDTSRFGYGEGGFRSRRADIHRSLVGTLVVDILDAKDNRLIWRGEASEVVSPQPKKNEKIIHKAVEKMFKKFPPGRQE